MKLALLFCLLTIGVSPAQDETKTTYAIVVHANNKATETGEAAKDLAKKLLLKELTQWPDGTEAKPYMRSSGSAENAALLKSVLGMGDAELARHWLKLKNVNGTTPPKDVDTERMMLKYVAKSEGAIGIATIEAAKAAEGVRILYEF
jgi:ABC-type phosphate transport system substrate-binding protein